LPTDFQELLNCLNTHHVKGLSENKPAVIGGSHASFLP
jgi:hypothetical protein